MSSLYKYDEDCDWVKIPCLLEEKLFKSLGGYSGYNPDDKTSLCVHVGFTDPEGVVKSLTVWGNEVYGCILKTEQYHGREERECEHWIAAHALKDLEVSL